MNPGAEHQAAVLLSFLLACGAYVQERFGLEWPEWTLRDGAVVAGEMADYEWATKSVLVRVPGEVRPRRLPARDLALGSKIRLLCAPPFQDRVSNQMIDLEQEPAFRAGVERLRQIGLGFAGGYVLLFLALNWLLAGWILRSGSVWRWLLTGVAFLLITVLAAGLVWFCIRQFGDHQVLEYLAVAASMHVVLFLSAVWLIYQAGPYRPPVWYASCCLVALVLPVTLCGTAVAAQVQRHTGDVSWAGVDRYLTEVWLVPMGLL